MLVIAIAASMVTPIGAVSHPETQPSSAASIPASVAPSSIKSLSSISFPSPINTSQPLSEYPAVSRALMLSGGSTYSALADINGDGLTDLIVAVSESKMISVFYRQPDGNFLTYPSANITLDSTPIGVAGIDSFGDGHEQIMVLERRTDDLHSERMLILNYTSPSTPFTEYENISVYQTASSFVIGNLNGDAYPDVAFVCPGLDPSVDAGIVEIRLGPSYTTSKLFNAGRGADGIAIGNFSSDGLQDLAVSNYYDHSVLVFFQPFSLGNAPAYNLTTPGAPLSIVSGDLNSDGLDDIAAVTENPGQLDFFFQSLGTLQSTPDPTYSRTIQGLAPTSIYCGDMNDDGKVDLAMLS